MSPSLTRTLLALGLCTGSTLAFAAPDKLPPTVEIDAAAKAKMAVCTDGKSHYIAIGPHEQVNHQLYYGDGKNMSEVDSQGHGMLSGTDFLDPRFVAPTYNTNFRGLDMRVYSAVEYDADKKSCALRCGERKQTLTLMSADDTKKLVGSATFRKSPRTREPYALARDDRGTYYYVDRGATADTKNNFRVFVGKKGAMKLQKMKDVASDSEGEVYSTATGDLRLITSNSDKPEFTWMAAGKPTKLVVLPIRDNLNLVHTTLGVYTGERYGTPCDDL
jgi:hypothetical protein